MKFYKIFVYVFVAVLILVTLLLIGSKTSVFGSYKIYVVQSGSMEPAIKTGALVLVKAESEYKIGEVITFGQDTGGSIPTTHRIAEIEQGGFITKGDANNGTDQNLVKRSEVIGRVILDVPYAGYMLSTAKTPIGFAVIVIIPALLIFIDELSNIYKEIQKMRRKKITEENV